MASGLHHSDKTSNGSDAAAAKAPHAHAQFVDSIPEIYDTHLGPLLFEFSAKDLARRLKLAAPAGIENVLEIACGTGIATEQLSIALAPNAAITATDLNQAMLDLAIKRRGQLENVTYRQADALQLPFEDACYDAAVCQFGIMFFPDKSRALNEIARVLRPGGWFAFNVWDSLANNRVIEIAYETIAAFFPTDPPDFIRTPFGYYQIDPIKALLEDEGFSNIDIDVVRETVRCQTAKSPARGMVEGNPGILQIKERATADPKEIVTALANAIEAEFGPPPLNIPLQEITFVAQKV